MTFFGHFIAGEDHQEIRRKIKLLKNSGVRPILAHDLEAEDHGQSKSSQESSGDYAAFYKWNYNFIKKSIDTLKDIDERAFIAIKMTSLLEAKVLLQLSRIVKPTIPLTSHNRLEATTKNTLEELIEKNPSLLTSEEKESFNQFLHRLDDIIASSASSNVDVLMDAEYSFCQPAIHRVAMEMMRKYNKKRPVVYNTYQNYLKVRKNRQKLVNFDLN